MGRYVALAVPAGLVVIGTLLNASVSVARPEYTRRTKKECTYCHPSDSWNLNEAGRYFRDHKHSLEGYKPGEGGGK